MRALMLAAVLGLAAAPAAAQLLPTGPDATLRQQELQMQQDLTRQRLLAQELELQALDARLRTQQAERDIAVQRSLPPLPPPSLDPNRPPPRIDTAGLASVPDDRLAASNAAVRAVTEGRR
jgi:hypothetical protein